MKRVLCTCLFVSLMFVNVSYARTYKIATVAWAGWSPANVADVKGFWKEEGIDVKVYTTANPLEALNLFRNKLVDIAFDMVGSMVGLYMDGLPISIIAETNWSHGGDKIIVKSDLDVAELKGKPIGVYFSQPSVLYFLNQYLSTIGLQASEARIIEMEADVLTEHFIAGRFGMIVAYDPHALRAVKEGNGKIVATSASYEGVIPEGMMALTDVLNEIPENDLKKILKGWVTAAEWIQDEANWGEYMEILNNYTFENDPPYSEQELKQMVNAVRIHGADMLRLRNQNGGGLQKYLADLKTFLTLNDILKEDFTVEGIFHNTPIMDILQNP